MELKEIEAIKEGSFKKITVQYFHQGKESQINCIVLIFRRCYILSE